MKNIALLLLFSLFILSGCGGGGSAPEGSTITINPQSIEVPDNRPSASWNQPQLVTVTVKNASGFASSNTKISISLAPVSHTGTTPDNTTVAQLYRGATPASGPFEVTTGDDGTYSFYIALKSGNGLNYTSSIIVQSGTINSTVPISVSGGGGLNPTIVINPAAVSLNNPDNSTTIWTRQLFSVVVRDSLGNPLKGTTITISAGFTTVGTIRVLKIYTAGGDQEDVYQAVTDDNGAYSFFVDYLSGGGASYTVDLEARTATAYATMKFTIDNKIN